MIDDSQEREEQLRAISLKGRRPEGPRATGYCLNPRCHERLADGLRWCGAECRDDFERLTENR